MYIYYILTIIVMKKRIKRRITQSMRWSVFIMTALTMAIKIAETAAYESFKILVENPDIAEFSTLVNSGYLLIR